MFNLVLRQMKIFFGHTPDCISGIAQFLDAFLCSRTKFHCLVSDHDGRQIVLVGKFAGFRYSGFEEHAPEDMFEYIGELDVFTTHREVSVLSLSNFDPGVAEQRRLYAMCSKPVAQSRLDCFKQLFISDESPNAIEDDVLVDWCHFGPEICGYVEVGNSIDQLSNLLTNETNSSFGMGVIGIAISSQ